MRLVPFRDVGVNTVGTPPYSTKLLSLRPLNSGPNKTSVSCQNPFDMATLVIQQDFLWPVGDQVNRVSDYSKAKRVSRLYLCLAQSDSPVPEVMLISATWVVSLCADLSTNSFTPQSREMVRQQWVHSKNTTQCLNLDHSIWSFAQ